MHALRRAYGGEDGARERLSRLGHVALIEGRRLRLRGGLSPRRRRSPCARAGERVDSVCGKARAWRELAALNRAAGDELAEAARHAIGVAEALEWAHARGWVDC